MCPWIRPALAPTSMPPGAEKGDLQAEPPGGVSIEPDDHALGRSRDGLTTKLHLGCEQGQKTPAIVTEMLPLIDKIPPVHSRRGRPCRRPDALFAGRAYGHE
ncbi:hypothetical protein AB0873_31670 [Micromonospora sp. NPDC047707]|uniref:hypothetical protein n=1 Tax=Micromonospora sp. NPDC047707 TaxID=3154498 RepID=UPI0034536564